MYLYNGRPDLNDKIEFVRIFANIADEYSGKGNYTNIIKMLNMNFRGEGYTDLNIYVDLKIRDFKGITYEVWIDSNRIIDEFLEKEMNYQTFEDSCEIIELNKLLKAVISNHPLSKLVYHLALIKMLNNASSSFEVFGINQNEIMSKGLYDHTINVVPIVNLDIDSPENTKVISDFNSFANKYPSLFSKNDLENMKNRDSIIETITYLKNAEIDFFNRSLDNAEGYLDFMSVENGLKTVYDGFFEFDPEFFENHFLNVSVQSTEGAFQIAHTRGSCGSCESGFTDYSMIALVLNINTFIDNKRKTL